MSKEIKFTTDGKKVVIVGKLNAQETIVQEIFIQGEVELPSGENFVVKSLHDEPSVSWKEKNLKDLESRYEKDSKDWNSKIDRLNEEKRKVYDSLSARVKWLRNVAKESRGDEFKVIINKIADFLDGSEKFVFVENYSDWHLEKFNEESTNNLLDRFESGYGRKRFDSMRLLSLYGNSDGSLTFRVNDYSDGSGSDKNVEFFKSEEEAILFLQNKLDVVKDYSDNHIKIAEKFNLKLDTEKLSVLQSRKKENLEKRIKDLESQKENLVIELGNL